MTATVAAASVRLADGVLVWDLPGRDPAYRARLERVRAFPGARYDADRSAWVAPWTAASSAALLRVLGEFGDAGRPFVTQGDLADVVEREHVRMRAALDGSRAHDAEVVLGGVRDPERLFPYQRAGVAFVLEHERVVLADDMGLGKSCQAICALATARADRILIVCPAALKLNWVREILLWTGCDPDDIALLDGRVPAPLGGERWTVVNYDILHDAGGRQTGWAATLAFGGFDAVVFDECHVLKGGDTTQRGRAISGMLRHMAPRWRLMLTGTPIINQPSDLYPLLKLLGVEQEVGGWNWYAQRFCAARMGAFGLDFRGATNLDELNLLLRSAGIMLRRRKVDVLTDLPERSWAIVPVPMSPADVRAYDRVLREGEQGMQDGDPGAVLRMINGLRQITGRAKSNAARGWIDQFLSGGEKLIVFGWHTELLSRIAAVYGAPTIMGGDSRLAVEQGKRRFQTDPECRVIVCNIAAGGVGHTLTAASNVVFLESAWTGAMMDQALDRAHRIGQTASSVTGWILTAQRPDGHPTIDDAMAEVVAEKRGIAREGVDGGGSGLQRAQLAAMLERLRASDLEGGDGGA